MISKRKLHPLTMTGLVFLILASLSMRIHPHTTSGKDLGDALTGLLYGLAIGCMLFGIWKTAHHRRNHNEPPDPQ